MKVLCSRCGRETEWDSALGAWPLCDTCWDSQVDLESEKSFVKREKVLKYIEANRVRIAVYQKLYSKAHRSDRDRRAKVYRESHRDYFSRRTAVWRETHREAYEDSLRERCRFTRFSFCVVCGLPIHFNRSYGWSHFKKDRAFHLAESERAVNVSGKEGNK